MMLVGPSFVIAKRRASARRDRIYAASDDGRRGDKTIALVERRTRAFEQMGLCRAARLLGKHSVAGPWLDAKLSIAIKFRRASAMRALKSARASGFILLQ